MAEADIIPPEAATYEDLRVALVLNGGVSLAIWMGGLAQELNRMARREGLYRDLAVVTETAPRVDIISGTSAGGLNGALLALAMSRGARLDRLRNLWVEKAAFASLLRDPFESKAPSLLDGDGYFLPELVEVFRAIAAEGEPNDPAKVPIELTMTGTVLKGRVTQVWDDFGAVISDVSHRGLFKFWRSVHPDPFAQPGIADALALAARSTSSFPGAFEASYCPVRPESAKATSRANLKGYADFQFDRFVLDGGVLDNKPFGPAIDAIFRQRATGHGRRVLAYVDPDARSAVEQGNDEPANAPSVARTVLAGLVELPRVESISEELKSLRERNRRVMEYRDVRVDLTAELGPPDIDALAQRLYPLYRRRRTAVSIDYAVSEVSGELARAGERGLQRRGRREWLTRTLAQQWLPWVPSPDWNQAIGKDAWPDTWRWGGRPAEQAAQVALDLMRRAQALASGEREPSGMAELWRRLSDVLAELGRLREREHVFWRELATYLPSELVLDAPEMSVDEFVSLASSWAEEALPGWMTVVHVPGEVAALNGRQVWGGQVQVVAELVLSLAEMMSGLFDDLRTTDDLLRAESVEDFERYLGFFVRAPADSVGQVAVRLLELEVITRATGSQAEDREQIVDLMQISADGASPLGGPAKTRDKLTGVQLAHFGAFYMRSWRANDWMFGRLDGARRLALLMLDPGRLRAVFHGRGRKAALASITGVALDHPRADVKAFLTKAWNELRVWEELAYLDGADILMPEALPACVEGITRRLHFDIIAEELDGLYRAVVDDLADGAPRAGAGWRFLKQYESKVKGRTARELAPDDLVRLFAGCEIGKQRIDQQVGSDMLTATASRAAAVAVAAGQANISGLGPVRLILKAMRAPVLGAYVFIQSAVSGGRTMAFLLGLTLAFSITVLGLRLALDAGADFPSWLVKAAAIAGATLWLAAVMRSVALGVLVAMVVGALVWARARDSLALPAWDARTWQSLALGIGALWLVASLRGPLRRVSVRVKGWLGEKTRR